MVFTQSGGQAILDSSLSASPSRSFVSSATVPGQLRVWKNLGWRANKIIVEADFRVDEWDKNLGVGQAFSFVQNGVSTLLYVGTASFLYVYRLSGDGAMGSTCEIPNDFFSEKTWYHLKFLARRRPKSKSDSAWRTSTGRRRSGSSATTI